ncbi:MAG: pyruvate kinase [Chthoniobacterales bacterium]
MMRGSRFTHRDLFDRVQILPLQGGQKQKPRSPSQDSWSESGHNLDELKMMKAVRPTISASEPTRDVWDPQEIDRLRRELEEIRSHLLRLENEFQPRLARHAAQRKSARNLIHYLALRGHDIRQLQERLAALGLSSLGRTESHVLAGIEAVLKLLQHLARRDAQMPGRAQPPLDFAEGTKLLRANTDALLGPVRRQRNVRIMVTVPPEAADDFQFVRDLLAGGMDCMRINCAHDNKAAWTRMLANLQKAKEELGCDCRVVMDLTGPKLRTGSIDPASQILKWRPQRDTSGRVTAPVQVWLTSAEDPEPPVDLAGGCMRLASAVLADIAEGDRIEFKDLRGKTRVLNVGPREGRNRVATSRQTVYLSAGNPLAITRVSTRASAKKITTPATVEPPAKPVIVVRPGETLILTRAPIPGRPAVHDEKGRVVRSATIACTLPEVFPDLRPQEPIWFDDGKIGGVIESVSPNEVTVRITVAKPGGDRLGADKGINLPESTIHLPALTAKDIEDLAFIVPHADLVGLSFVRRPEDVGALQSELERLLAPGIGIVIKIETRTAFEQLPMILLEAMQGGRHVGVMIARGDLAVECGWQRLAEVQEEILWVCEAAHIPVIWATQVLESLAKKGTPSRAEITDAAMGERAECVMLNKGPHLVTAVRVLDDILSRMEAHQNKKSARLRRLHLSAVANASGNRAD